MITPTMREFVVLFLLSEIELEALRKRVFKILVFEGEREKSTFIFVYVCERERESQSSNFERKIKEKHVLERIYCQKK